ncbi:MAG: ThuA domain-containing protein [Verrucomicrobiota bacterium]
MNNRIQKRWFGILALTLLLAMSHSLVTAAEVLIVADEFPAMELLAGQLKAQEKLECQIVAQTNMPAQLDGYQAVVVYVHGNLKDAPAKAIMDYTRNGGKLVALHHTISSGKRKTTDWLPFLGVELPQKEFAVGGYKWIEGVTLEIANLAPSHFITTNKITFPQTVTYTRQDVTGPEQSVTGFTLHETEVYLNHVWTEPHTVLLGFKYTDAKTGKVYMQDRAGWTKSAGKGYIVYLMAGHSARDFKDACYGRMVLNAVIYRP